VSGAPLSVEEAGAESWPLPLEGGGFSDVLGGASSAGALELLFSSDIVGKIRLLVMIGNLID